MNRERMAVIEEQVSGLIDLVLDGVDADELIGNVYEEINEGPGNGPYHIGSKVKINSSWSGQGVGGENVSVARGDVVSVVLANIGEEGQDRMVLLSDGKTRVVVPFAILGESLEEQNSLKTGPKGHAVPSAKGKLGGTISGKVQGDDPTPEKKALKPVPGARVASSMPSQHQGRGKPKDAPGAQVPGQMAASTISGKTVEQIVDSVVSSLDELGEKNTKAQDLSEVLVAEDDEIMFAIVHEAMFGGGEYTLDDLHKLVDLMQEKKKCNKKNSDDDEDGYTEEDIDEIYHVMQATQSAMKKRPKKR